MNDLTRMAGGRALAPTPRTMPPLPDLLCNRYRIERLLGVGGMGAVYGARDLLREQFGDPHPYLALKTLNETFREYPDANALLYSEYALTTRLNHRHLVRFYSFEVDTDSQCAFITLEWLKGCTLDTLLLQHPQGLPWLEARRIGLHLLDALRHAHERGVLHGDIKPSNLILGDDTLCLFDFGLGQATEGLLQTLPRLSRSRFSAWTPRYAAPELLDGGALSTATDTFALACVLYELCSGRHPFHRQNAKQAKAMDLPLLAPNGLPKKLWPAVRNALSVDPEKRCTLNELKHAFEQPFGWWRRTFS